MSEASETSSFGRRSRGNDEASSSGHLSWPHILLSRISGWTERKEDALEHSVVSNNIPIGDSDGIVVRQDQDIDFGYGSISRDSGNIHSDRFSESEGIGQDESTQRSPLQENPDPTISCGLDLDHDDVTTEAATERRRKMRQQRRSLVAWGILVFLSCSCLTLLLAGTTLLGPRYADNTTPTNNSPLSEIFAFDKLFGGVKKKPSRAVIDRPPPTERSVFLVLRAQVTPENPIVQDLDRKLTAKGMRDAEGLGIYLHQHNIPEPDWIFVSPAERTAFTTELIRRHWASHKPVAFEDILYTLEFNDYFNFVAGLNDHFRRVMIVGHNPAILNSAKKLMKTHGIEDFPDCGFLEIRWNDLVHWSDVQPYSGSSTMAIDPNNNFFFSSPKS